MSRATAFNSSLSQRAAARGVLSQLTSSPDVSPVRPPDAICRAAYGDDAAASMSAAAEEGTSSPPAQTASAGGLQHGDHAPAASPAAGAAGSAGGELLPAAARQVGRRPGHAAGSAAGLTRLTLLSTNTLLSSCRATGGPKITDPHRAALDVVPESAVVACGCSVLAPLFICNLYELPDLKPL